MSALLDMHKELGRKGIELCKRTRGLKHNVWPAAAWKYLTEQQRQYITAHAEEIERLAASGALTQTSVVWTPPSLDDLSPPIATEPASPLGTNGFSNPRSRSDVAAAPICAAGPKVPESDCLYCGRPCVGKANKWYRVFHWNAPDEIAHRNKAATDVLYGRAR